MGIGSMVLLPQYHLIHPEYENPAGPHSGSLLQTIPDHDHGLWVLEYLACTSLRIVATQRPQATVLLRARGAY